MKTGVYVLMRKRVVVYVGATRNWPNRLAQHKDIDFTDARLIECPEDKLFETERRLIGILKPKVNRQHNVKITRKPVPDWVRRNPDKVKEAFLNGKLAALGQSLKSELGYSNKSTSSDIGHVLVRHYEIQNNVVCDFETKKIRNGKR